MHSYCVGGSRYSVYTTDVLMFQLFQMWVSTKLTQAEKFGPTCKK